MNKLLTQSGMETSALTFGAMQFGAGSDAHASRVIYHMCRDAGINHFDTANGYTNGQSEQILGGCIRQERDDIFVATKVGYTGGAAPENLEHQFDISRQRLGMDVVDLLYLHRFDPETPLEATLDWFQNQIALGRIRYVGLSNFAAWQIVQAQFLISEMGGRIDAVQPMYNLAKRQAEVEILPLAQSEQLGVIPYSPLGGGLLSGKYGIDRRPEQGRIIEKENYAKSYRLDVYYQVAERFAQYAADREIHPVTLAVAWVQSHPAITAPIIGGRNLEQLAPSLAAAEFDMSDAQRAELSMLPPTPPPATDRLETQV